MSKSGESGPREKDLVVVVDDERPVLAALRRLLRAEPYELLVTQDPREALDWIGSREVSLVLSDYRMPGMDGVELLLAVQERSPATERLLLTAHPGEPVVLESLGQGLAGLAAKPWDGDILKETLRSRLHERRRLEREILVAAERERRRIGQDLHDTLGQELTALSLLSKTLEGRLRSRAPDEAVEAAEIAALARKAIQTARSLARGLQPADIQGHDLPGRVDRMAATVREAYGVNCRARWDRRVVPRDTPVATQLYWIVHEALTNALRHAKPENISIEARRSGSGARIHVRDDGRGLPPIPGDAAGIGLHIMKSRARMIRAALRVEPDPAGGTRVVCEIPASALGAP